MPAMRSPAPPLSCQGCLFYAAAASVSWVEAGLGLGYRRQRLAAAPPPLPPPPLCCRVVFLRRSQMRSQ